MSEMNERDREVANSIIFGHLEEYAVDEITAADRIAAYREEIEARFKIVGETPNPVPPAMPEDEAQTVRNIQYHMDELLDNEMRAHASADKSHDLHFQIFRILGGYRQALDELAALRSRQGSTAADGYIAALTPSAETKAAYIGEFTMPIPCAGEDGEEVLRSFNVPWTTIKEIMAAIRKYAEAACPSSTQKGETE